MKLLKKILFIVLCFVSWQNIKAQNLSTYSFNELYNFEENTVFSMIQDTEGFVWLGTSNGLYRFDGFNFKHFTFPGFDIEYYNLKNDDFGRVWFANFGGQLFYLENDSINLVVHNTLDNNYIYEYLVYDKQNIFYHTLNAKNIVRVNLSGKQEKVFLLNEKEKITSSVVFKDHLKLFIEEDFENNRLIKVIDFYGKNLQKNIVDSCFLPIKSSKKFARKIDGNTFAYIQHHNELDIVLFSKTEKAKVYHSEKLNSKTINNYKVVNEKLVLLGIKKSFYLQFSANNKIETKALTEIKNASNILLDNEDNLWISSLNNGIYIAPNTVFQNTVISPFEAIKQVKVSKDNEVFYVTDEGKLYEFDWTTKTPNLIYNENLNPNFKIDINPFKKELLIPGNHWYYNINTKKWKHKNESNFFKDIHFLDKYNAIISLNSTDIISFNKLELKTNYLFDTLSVTQQNEYGLTRIANGRANIIAEECNKKHLYVNQISGIVHYSNKKAETLNYQGKPIIASVFKTGSNALWIADISGNIHQIKEGEIVYTHQLGSRVEHIAVADNLVFLQTKQAIFRLDYKQNEILKIDQTDGLINESIVNLSTTDSSLMVWGANTLQEIPFSYQYTNTTAPSLSISKMLVNGKTRDITKAQKFKHNENNIEFYFQSNSIRSQKQRSYYYRIKELSDDWKKTNFEVPYVRYSQLAPGNYTFQVKVENEDEKFSNTIDLAFKIDKHYTEKWWFILLITALLASLIYWIFAMRIKTLNKQARLKQEKESLQKDVYKAKISAIRAQMNPHFIFNALNSIQTLVLRGDIDNTYTYINKFAGLIRQTLSFSEEDYVSLEKEIVLLETYLNLEKLRFRDDFNYEIIQKNLPNISLPPMLIQPFVENALKHGLLHLPTNREIKLTFYFDEVLVCEVEDNGIGRKASEEINKRRNKEHKSFAISALKHRFEILQENFNYKIGFTYFDLEENNKAIGTKVVIRIPFKYSS